MRSFTFTSTAGFFVEECYTCGVPFAMTQDFKDRRLKDRDVFYCPAGHPQHYTGETEEQRLKREVERLAQMRDAADQRAAKARRDADQITKAHRKMRVRVMNGVCPCCNRSFENLRRHMASEHPDFDKHRSLAALRQAFGMTQADLAKEVGFSEGTGAPYVSKYESGRAIPAYAERALENWIERQEGA